MNSLPLWFTLVGCGLSISCASTADTPRAEARPENAVMSPAQSDQAPSQSPWMFNEAKLPEGFPKPGPVGEVVVKDYPAYRAAFARVDADAATRGAGGRGDSEASLFQTLFRHIKDNDIPMTAPVEMAYASEAAGDGARPADTETGPRLMGFMYQNTRVGDVGSDGAVEVVDVPPMRVVSVTVRGSYSQRNYEAALAQLEGFLAEHPQYRRAGEARVLGYNSPMVPWFARISEVQIPVTAVAGPAGQP